MSVAYPLTKERIAALLALPEHKRLVALNYTIVKWKAVTSTPEERMRYLDSIREAYKQLKLRHVGFDS